MGSLAASAGDKRLGAYRLWFFRGLTRPGSEQQRPGESSNEEFQEAQVATKLGADRPLEAVTKVGGKARPS